MVERLPSNLINESNIRSMRDVQAGLEEQRQHMYTGKKMLSAKDNPIDSSTVLNLELQRSKTENNQKNIDFVEGELNYEEIQLRQAVDSTYRSKELCLEVSNGIRNLADRRIYATQLTEMRSTLLTLANSQVNDRYIFSGAKNDHPAVLCDTSGNYYYNGDNHHRNVQIGPSLELQTNDTAEELFFNLPSTLTNTTGYSGLKTETSTAFGLVDTGVLQPITANTLKINEITIAAATSDGVSTVDNTASAIAIANAINLNKDAHGVTATANPTAIDFTGGNYGVANDPVAGNLTINNTQISGTPATNNVQGWVDLINSNNIPGVVASVNNNELSLTAADGRNIQLQTNGGSTSLTFNEFDTTAGALNKVQRSTVTLTDYKAFNIAGSMAGTATNKIGIAVGEHSTNANSGTGSIGTVSTIAKRPDGSTNNETYTVKFTSPTSFNIYKSTNPDVKLTDFKKFASGETIKDAKIIKTPPADFNAGDTIVIDGLQFTITGAPQQDDTFIVKLEPSEPSNIFDDLTRIINVLNTETDNEKIRYELSCAMDSINYCADNILSYVSSLGAKMEQVNLQKDNNEEFILLSSEMISNIRDADPVEALTQISQYQFLYEAILSTISKMGNLSLFKYI